MWFLSSVNFLLKSQLQCCDQAQFQPRFNRYDRKQDVQIHVTYTPPFCDWFIGFFLLSEGWNSETIQRFSSNIPFWVATLRNKIGFGSWRPADPIPLASTGNVIKFCRLTGHSDLLRPITTPSLSYARCASFLYSRIEGEKETTIDRNGASPPSRLVEQVPPGGLYCYSNWP